MTTPAETRAANPPAPGTEYELQLLDGTKVCDAIPRAYFTADTDQDAVERARQIMASRPAGEVGTLDRPLRRGGKLWVADLHDQGARVVDHDIHVAADLRAPLFRGVA